MKRFIELVGGCPFQQDDLTFIQDNVQELISALIEQYGSRDLIVYGGEISVADSGGANPLLSITKGALYKADEEDIFIIDEVVNQALTAGTTLNDVLTLWEWDKLTTYSGSRQFADGFTKQPLETNKAVLVETPSTWTGVEAGLITAKQIRQKEANVDIVNNDYLNPSDFTTVYNDGASNVYKSYTLSEGQHILRMYTPSGGNATITNIIPPSDIFDGYELTVYIKKDPSSDRGLGFYRGTASGNVTPNLNIKSENLISYNTSTLVLERTSRQDYYVTFNGTHTDMYEDFGQYDINLFTTGTFMLLFRWNAKTNIWMEVARNKYNS